MAASSSSLPSCCMSGISSRATYGKVTNMVASMMPGSAKMMLMLCACSHTPNQPCSPNSSTKTMPEITGEIASGRSMSVMRMLLPRNSNLAMAQAAASPNTVLIGTTTAAVMSVRRIGGGRVRVGEAVQVGGDPPGERHGEHRGERGEQQRGEEGEGDRDAQPAHERVHPGVLPGAARSHPRRCSERRRPSACRPHVAAPAPGLQQVDGEQHHERRWRASPRPAPRRRGSRTAPDE